jgi:hypothetical protein
LIAKYDENLSFLSSFSVLKSLCIKINPINRAKKEVEVEVEEEVEEGEEEEDKEEEEEEEEEAG